MQISVILRLDDSIDVVDSVRMGVDVKDTKKNNLNIVTCAVIQFVVCSFVISYYVQSDVFVYLVE